MKGKRRHTIILAAVVGVLAGALVLAACGGETAATGSPSPTATSLADKWAEILGHQPTGLAATIAAKGTIVVANDANYPPLSYVDDQGELVGFDVDVANRTMEILGVAVEFINPDYDAVPTGLTSNRFDASIGSMSPTEERRQMLDFTQPYYYEVDVVVVKEGQPTINTVEELAGKKIGVTAGTIYIPFLEEHKADIKPYDNEGIAFGDLVAGRLDGVFTSTVSGAGAITAGKPMVLSEKPLMYLDVDMAVKKGEADLLALLDHAVQTMHADGALSEMSKKWFNGLDVTQKL